MIDSPPSLSPLFPESSLG